MTLATLFQDVEECFRRPSCVCMNETEEAFVLETVVAGVKPKDIEITFEKGALKIEAKTGRYNYSYMIPVDMNGIDPAATPEASCEDGVLKISLPKSKASKPFKIAVKGA